jgi:hypothetical protein
MSWLWSSMKSSPPRSTKRFTFLRSASLNLTGKWPVMYSSGYRSIRSSPRGTTTPVGATVISV